MVGVIAVLDEVVVVVVVEDDVVIVVVVVDKIEERRTNLDEGTDDFPSPE